MPPTEPVAKAVKALAAAEQQLADAVGRARAEGATWSQIGHELGITKQAAHERFSPKPTPPPTTRPKKKPRPEDLAAGSKWLSAGS